MQLNGLRVSRETQQRLEHFVALLEKWSRTTNLIAPSTLSALWTRHIADSAQIFQLLPKPLHWVDLGSGGGFPGIVTAIFLAELGDGTVDLIESNRKKAAFLRVCVQECGARATVHPIRISEASKSISTCDAVSARAFASLGDLFEHAAPWATANHSLKLLLHKGRDYRVEIEKALCRWDFDLLEHQSVVDPEAVVLEISRLRQKR